MSATVTTVKEAIKQWEEQEYDRLKEEAAQSGRLYEGGPVIASEAHIVNLVGVLPPIQRMDKDLLVLRNVRHLGLSTNCIDKISPHLKDLPHLEILSLARNNIRKLENLDLPNLKQLWLSHNRIEKLSGIERLRSLNTLFLGNNLVASWLEIERFLSQLPNLTELLLVNNPIERSQSVQDYRIGMVMRTQNLQKLDGKVRER